MSGRHLLLALHRYVGVSAGLLLVLIGLTGSLLVFRDEIDEVLNPTLLRVAPREEFVPLQAVLNDVLRSYPHDRPVAIRLPRSAEGVYEIWMNGEEGLRVYIDPYTGEIRGSRFPIQTFTGFLFLAHAQLLGGEIGETIVGVGAFLLLGLGVTGIVLWWPGGKRLWQGFTVPWRAPVARVAYDLHRVVGIVAIAVLAVIAITGACLTFHSAVSSGMTWLTGAPLHPAPPVSPPPAGESGGPPRHSPVALDTILQHADQALPGAVTTWISLPRAFGEAVVVRKKFAEEIHPHGRSFVHLDQQSGRVLLIDHALQAPLATRIDNLLYPLHIGRVGGFGARLLYLLIGLAPAVLFLTGLLMWRSEKS